MTNGPISEALKRRQDRPDIHKPVDRNAYSFDESIRDMVLDLKEHVPELSIRQLSSLVGVGKTFVTKVLDQTVPAERWTAEDNPASCAAELAALCEHHTRYESVEIDRLDPDERPMMFTSPAFHDPYRRADQSHTFKRPITLATTPFSVAA